MVIATALRHGFAPDPVLPQRDLLLDADFVRDWLSDAIGRDGHAAIAECTLVRSKYRIGESLRVVYQVKINGTVELVTARAFRAGASESAYGRALGDAVSLDTLHAVLHDSGRETVWWTFPNDRRLSGVAALLAPGDDLAGLLGPTVTWSRSEVVEYAPERSVTLRALDDGGATLAYVKAYAPGTADVAALAGRYEAVARALAQTGARVSSPTPLGWSVDLRLLLLQAMPGRHWSQLSSELVERALGRLGAAIAALHNADSASSVSSSGLRQALRHFGRLDVRRVAHSTQLISRARPDVAAEAWRLGVELAAGPGGSDPLVVLHGDCHPKNALLDGDDVALIDLDQAGIGPASADIGSLLARLRHEAILTGDQVAYRLRARAFLDGYSQLRPLPADSSLRWHTAAALVAERAMRAVNRVHLDALSQLDELLDAAAVTLRAGVQP